MTAPLHPEEDVTVQVLVIGAGQAGLAMAWHLRRVGIPFLVVDAGSRIGDAWRSRWDSLRLFSPAEYNSLPGSPFPAPAGTYPTKDEVADYLERYARTFGLPVRLQTRVVRLHRSPDGRFIAETTTGTLTASQVVVATGSYVAPHVPALAGGLAPTVVQLHSSAYRRPADLPHGPVLVVGAGNSGVQIAAELAASGRTVSIALGSRPYMMPQRPLGRDLFWWLTMLGLVARPTDEGPIRPPSRRGALVDSVWRRIRAGGVASQRHPGARQGAGVEIVIGTSWRRLRASGVRIRPRAVSACGDTVGFADGTTVDVAGVVWATGFRPEYPWLDVPGVVLDGQVRHVAGVSDVPGLVFLGLPWQRSRSSHFLGFVAADAAWLAERLRAPDPDCTAPGEPASPQTGPSLRRRLAGLPEASTRRVRPWKSPSAHTSR
ncbi:flavin-containing monooxygenase [Geodermatophilus sp. SYSU D01045]